MPFAIKDWHNSPVEDTPISAAALEDLETRLSGYSDQLVDEIDSLLVTRDLPDVWSAIDSNAAIRLEQTRNGSQAGDPVLVIVDPDMADPYKVQTFIDSSGGYQSGRWILSSQKRILHTPGDITKGSTIHGPSGSTAAAGLEPWMIAASTDIDGPAFAGECYTVDGTNPNCSAFAAYDLDDAHTGPFGGYSGGYGRKKFVIKGNGELRWGADLQKNHTANHDVSLGRGADGVPQFKMPGQALSQLRVATSAAQAGSISMGRAATQDYLSMGVNGAVTNTANVVLNGRQVIGMSSAPLGTAGGSSISVGNLDDSTAVGVFSVEAGTNAALKALVARARPTGGTGNIFEAQNGATTPLLSITQTGALELLEQADPAAPAANLVRFYSKDISGKTMLATRDATRVELLPGSLTGTATWDPASIANAAMTSTTVTVTGAAVGDPVAVGFSVAVPAGALLVGAVTAADTVTVTLHNNTGGTLNLASGTIRATVWKFA